MVIFSCSTKDDGEDFNGELDGAWTLDSVSCFCFFGTETDFTATRLIFDVHRNALTVINDSAVVFFKSAGEYIYTVKSNVLYFEDGTRYEFEIQENQLTLTYEDNPNIADDEVAYFLTRN